MSTYDPTDKQLEAARRRLAGLDDSGAVAHTFGAVGGNLDAASLPNVDLADVIRECRAALAAYDERRGGTA
jgi:hypothetical protein